MRAAFVKFSLFVTLLNPIIAHAADGDWKVAKTSQSVKYALDKKGWITVHLGDIVPNGAWVSTGPRGRVQLTRGVESISFQPDTLASIVTTGTSDSQTEVIQKTGTLDLEIEHRDHPHAKVETPFLAAVVKGTVFRVSVTAKKASVSVTRGLVQVRSFASGQQSNIGPTQSASVSAVAGMTVKGIDVTPQIVSVPPTVSPVPSTSMLSTTSTAPSSTSGPDAKSSAGSNAESGNAGSRGSDGGSSGRVTSSTTNPTTSTSNNSGDTLGQSANGGDSSDASTSGASGKIKGNGNNKGDKDADNAQGADDNSNSADKNDKGDKGNNGNAYGHDKGKGKDKGK